MKCNNNLSTAKITEPDKVVITRGELVLTSQQVTHMMYMYMYNVHVDVVSPHTTSTHHAQTNMYMYSVRPIVQIIFHLPDVHVHCTNMSTAVWIMPFQLNVHYHAYSW